MKYFSILGERCSGTHFVEYALINNFNITYRRLQKEKHFFGHGDEVFKNKDADDTLFIYVIRHPIDWIDSFFKRLHHVPPENKRNIYNFINNEFYSIYEEGPEINSEIMEDRNIITNERYKNIFELRKIKNDYITNVFSQKVKNFIVVKYEDLRDDYENTLDIIMNNFDLEKTQPEYEKILNYKGTYTALYYKKPILIPEDVIEKIKKSVDIEQENSFGYII
jgi:hypothetical protein